ncbi:class I SAM-dependent methyltransferase [Aphanothece sacrum]|uniref:Class I SAM-dependent methyltransferase n=1 Tax=Aphanothece sacrum FPU1 TaxID=1920663 RepID=A0A401INQ4_APHSA|nr:class I SAM-dependent methyltransferase [Aphanothece sacrum]GBF82872.1 hypothetical protein AsFPU1_4306 [Aphanothece sacrum FPU1]GBF86251.1 hypothetical protein AsFPU3_3322 [Aphanothece sacrum FPU3]
MMVKPIIKKILRKLPYLKDIFAKADQRDILMKALFVPPGHFYSPIPSLEEIKLNEAKIFDIFPQEIPGINLQQQEQLNLLNIFQAYYDEQPFKQQKTEGLRYYFENDYYSYSDGIFLYCMMRYAQPQKIIEIGSGFSSCVMLDTNELFLDKKVSCTFIEPYPERLLSLVGDEEGNNYTLIKQKLQDIDLQFFQQLSNNDILFIDSTHVAKTNSDVNYIFFEILPSLKSGVLIHIHDIFYPFEYPKSWIIQEKRAWNEVYMLRAFLQYNNNFKIELFNNFLTLFFADFFQEKMPLCQKNTGGSIWLRKIQ